MKNVLKRLSLTAFLILGLAAQGCSKAEEELEQESEEDGGGGGGGGANPLDPYAGIWIGSCTASSAINSVAAYRRVMVQVNANGTFAYTASYYSNSGCTGTSMIWMHTPGTVTVGSDTSQPAGGKMLHFTHGSNVGIHTTSSTDGRDHLNSVCGWGGSFNLNGGLVPMADWNCTGDSRFSIKGPNTVADLAVVINGSNVETTAMNVNMPGVASGSSVDTTTSLTFLKQ